MKIITLWVGAFWFALLHHLSKNHPDLEFFAYEKDDQNREILKSSKQHPYFFPGRYLGENIVFLNCLETLKDFDLIIIAIPAQYIQGLLYEIKDSLKSGVILLNIAKGIDAMSLKTIWDITWDMLWDFPYHYAVLSGGMIASELVEWNMLWAQIWCRDNKIGLYLKKLFASDSLKVTLSFQVKNIELSGSLKNIFALYMWYLEWKWYQMSSIWYFFCQLYRELPLLIEKLWWEKSIHFEDFSLWGDLIATCFGNSRNRYFWRLVWEWKTPKEAQDILNSEKKHSEWYATLGWLYDTVIDDDLPYFLEIGDIFYKN